MAEPSGCRRIEAGVEGTFLFFEFVFILYFIYMSPPAGGAGVGTLQDFLSGCQRITEPVLSPLLYKSKTKLT